MGVLFSVYSLPNIFFVLIAGVLIDKVGTSFVLFVCLICVVSGNLITIGNNYWYMLSGRIVYGIGTECKFFITKKKTQPTFNILNTISIGCSWFTIGSSLVYF